jgi:hypothetical protein
VHGAQVEFQRRLSLHPHVIAFIGACEPELGLGGAGASGTNSTGGVQRVLDAVPAYNSILTALVLSVVLSACCSKATQQLEPESAPCCSSWQMFVWAAFPRSSL